MLIKTLIILLLFSGLFAPATGQDQGFEFTTNRNHITVPISVNHNLIIIPLSINGSPPLNFILDTGVKTTILTEPLVAQFLDLDLSERIFLFGLGGEGILQAAKVTGVTMDLYSIRGENMDLVVLPEGILSFSEIFGFPVFGIIGYDLFKQFPIQINYITKQARIYREPDYRIRRRTQVVPFDLVGGKPYTQVKAIGHSGDTITTNLLIDLGASHPIYLNRTYLDMAPKTLKGFLGKGISGALLGRVGRIEQLLIGDLVIEQPITSFPDNEFLTFMDQEHKWEGIIGGGILSRFDIIIDYQSGKMLLRPNGEFNNPFNFNPSGMEVVADGPDYRKFTVYYVRPGSAAYEAGIMSGDRIISVNNNNFSSLTLQKIQDILSGEMSNLVSMVVMRNEKLISKHFRLRNDI